MRWTRACGERSKAKGNKVSRAVFRVGLMWPVTARSLSMMGEPLQSLPPTAPLHSPRFMLYSPSGADKMVGYAQILRRLPQEWQMTMLELAEAMEQHLREQLAVRREDFIALSAAVQELADAQARTEAELREYRARSEERFARIEAALERLTEAQARTEVAIQELRDAQARTEQTLQALIAAQQAFEKRLQRLETRVGRIEGRLLEIVYRERVTGYFGKVLRRPRAVDLSDILDDLEARLSRAEVEEILNLDLLVTGRPRPPQGMPDQPDIWLAVEISATVDVEDITRAVACAALLRKAGYPAIPVAGQELTIVARTLAQEEAVLILQDGGVLLWEEAFARFSGARRGNSPPSAS